MFDKNKICFITCVNDEMMYQEAVLYIKNLSVPAGMTIEVCPVRGAGSLTSGYNSAMKISNAKYKIYLHQDLLLVNENYIKQIINIFQRDENIGMIGIAGTNKLPVSCIWWQGEKLYGKVCHATEPESMHISNYGDVLDGEYSEAEAIDGLIMATQYDVYWREDIFDGWHFYDISQCQEFIKAGYKIVIPYQSTPWCVHLSADKPLDNTYTHYQKLFLKEYYQRTIKEE